ncbi:MAG: hypothetical protein PHW27_10185, partial [Melioribacteraceae bacterium]|nr:hypothetical protein [Melioribacteraceae bacterium]
MNKNFHSKNNSKSLITDYRSLITFLLLTPISLLLFSCNSTEPPPPPPVIEPTDTVTVSITDKTHRSITINVKTTLNNKNWKIELFREKQAEEDTLLTDFSVETEDTTIIDDNGGKGLELETEYGYYTILSTETGEIKDTSEKVIGRTLGATSHNYVWEEYTIGESGVLYDVWGTDENNVYAVGGVRINDTTYGVIHWDGTEWKPSKRVGGVYAVFGFSENDVWAVGGAVEHYDGINWKRIDAETINNQDVILDPVLYNNRGYTAIWGTSSENLYFGNQGGKIVHWDGRRGSVEEVQASEIMRDIYGTNSNNIYASAGSKQAEQHTELFHYDGLVWRLIEEATNSSTGDGLIGPFETLWLSGNEIYLGGNVVYDNKNNRWNYKQLGFFIEKIRGIKPNNIFAVGH